MDNWANSWAYTCVKSRLKKNMLLLDLNQTASAEFQ